MYTPKTKYAIESKLGDARAKSGIYTLTALGGRSIVCCAILIDDFNPQAPDTINCTNDKSAQNLYRTEHSFPVYTGG